MAGKAYIWTPERIAELRSMIEGGMTVKEIVAQTGWSENSIYTYTNRHNIKLAPRSAEFRKMLSERAKLHLKLGIIRINGKYRGRGSKIASWCPEHLREDYLSLKRKGYKAAERRALIEQQIAKEQRA